MTDVLHLPVSPGETPTATIHLRPTPVWPPLAEQGDALADPSHLSIAESLYQLLPTGAAWRAPDGAAFDANSRLGGFLRGLAGDLATLYRKLFSLSMESTASTLDWSLDDWETEFGLPNPCLGENPSREVRIRFLLAKVRSSGTITPADFIDLAATIGYEITIREPKPFRAGRSRCGSSAEPLGGTVKIEFYWIVKPGRTGVIPFRAGRARAGRTPLGEVQVLSDLQCLFREIAPAWTMPLFDYS